MPFKFHSDHFLVQLLLYNEMGKKQRIDWILTIFANFHMYKCKAYESALDFFPWDFYKILNFHNLIGLKFFNAKIICFVAPWNPLE